MEDSSWPEESRAALISLARLAPVLAEGIHGTSSEHVVLRENNAQRVQLQKELQSVYGEVEAQLTNMVMSTEERGEYQSALAAALARADTRSSRPSLAATLSLTLQKEQVLEMQQTVARELLLRNGSNWADGDVLQRTVTSLASVSQTVE